MSVEKMSASKKVSAISVIINLMLLVLKLFISIVSKSQGMLADTLNSAGDIVNSAISYIGAKISSKPNDSDHPHGHGKADYIFAGVISIFMIVAALNMIYSSVLGIINHNTLIFSHKLILVCIITIVTKFIMFLYTRAVYKKDKNILIRANNEDHRNDMFLTTGTIIGITFSYFGFYFVDGIVAILISLTIIYNAFKLLLDVYKVLMDTSLDSKKEDAIKEFIEKNENVIRVDSMISKPVGNGYIIIVKLSMKSELNIKFAHDLTGKIKSDILNEYDFIKDVIIHINPC